LGLVHGTDPLIRPPLHASLRYFRMHGVRKSCSSRTSYGHTYSDAEFSALRGLCAGKTAFVYFNNATMRRDAERFKELLEKSDVRVRGTIPSRRTAG